MRTALLTFTTGGRYDAMADLVRSNRDAYCVRHGYTHLVHAGGPYGPEPGRYYSLQRLRYVIDCFEGDAFDLVWVLNVAAVIMRSEIPVTSLLPLDGPADVFLVRAVGALNAGSLVVRRSAQSLAWMRYMIEHSPGQSHEQAALMATETHPEHARVLHVLPCPSLNSYRYELYPEHRGEVGCSNDYQPGHFVLHFPGLPYEQREALVRDALAEAT